MSFLFRAEVVSHLYSYKNESLSLLQKCTDKPIEINFGRKIKGEDTLEYTSKVETKQVTQKAGVLLGFRKRQWTRSFRMHL